MSRLLLDEAPLVVQPSLVRKLGIAEAALVQQLHYWRDKATRTHDGETWIYKTYADWSKEIGLSTKAARGALDRLRKEGVVVAMQNPTDARDKTLWWRVNYRHPAFADDPGSPSAPEGSPTDRGGISHAGVPGSTETTSTRGGENARAGARNAAPEDFPDELRPHAAKVMAILTTVAEQHNARAVTKLALGRTIMAYPRRPLVETAHALAIWAADPPRPIVDVVGTYRSFLKRERDLAAIERLEAGPLPAGVTAIRPRNQSAAERRAEGQNYGTRRLLQMGDEPV